MKASRFLTPLIVAALLGGGIYWRIAKNNAASEETSNPRATTTNGETGPAVSTSEEFDASEPAAVIGKEVIRDTLVMKVTADGRAVAARHVPLSAKVEGPIRRILVRENTYVRAGDLLIDIDPSSLRYDLETALLDSARAWTQFHADTIGSGQNPNAAERAAATQKVFEQSGIPASRTRLQQLRERMSQAEVRAPFNGRVADLEVVQDQWVGPGTELVSVMQLDPIRVVVEVTESEIWQIEVGRGADVEFSAIPDEVFRGRIIAINPQADQRRAIPVTIEIPNPEGRILPGFYAEAKLDGERYPDLTLVPLESVVERDIERRDLLFVFEGDSDVGTAQWQYVTRGRRNDTHVEIIDDPDDTQDRLLEPGEIVLVAGHELLIHGANVRLVTSLGAVQQGRPR